MTRTRSQKQALNPGAALIALRERPFEVPLLAAIVGSGAAKTHAEVARAFGVAPNTIKQSWVPAGMPGVSGKYPLAEIAAWRLRHLDEIDKRRRDVVDLSDTELKRRASEAEARKLEAQADRLEREEQEATGNLVARSVVVALWRQHASTLAERIGGIPDQIAPMLPAEISQELTEDIRRKANLALQAYSEETPRALGIG